MKKAFGKVVIILIVLGVSYWIISSIVSTRQAESKKQADNAETQEVKAEELLKIKKSVQDMVAKYNAMTDWQGILKKKSIEPVFTLEVQDALIRKDSRPIVFVSAVEDIVRDSNNYTAHFHNKYKHLFRADIHFVLDVTPDQVQEIMKHPNSIFEYYAVFVNINSVRKIRYEVVADDDKGVSIDSSMTSNVFEATGRCLDLIYVGGYKTNDLLEIESK